MNRRQQGFTLIELMIVVAIIGILASIASTSYQDYVIRSQVSEGAVLADGVKTAMVEFYDDNGRWPPSNSSAGLATSTSIAGSYVVMVDVGAVPGKIVIDYGNNANPQIRGKVLTYSGTASSSQGSINWNCSSLQSGGYNTNVTSRYLPSVCRA